MNQQISLAHGSGGSAMQQLIDKLLIKSFSNPYLEQREDQARLPLESFAKNTNNIAFTTDSYVIDPLFFPGGDIGKLAICGTCNDLAVGGAKPQFLTCSLIIEEGFEIVTLEQIIHSMATTAQQAGVQIVAGDTKVVPRGAVDKLFINTCGIGAIPNNISWGMDNIKAGDSIIITGNIGEHGATILNLRENLDMESDLRSDCAVLYPLIEKLYNIDGVRTIRDATRGGVTAILHEFAKASRLGMCLDESKLPIRTPVRGLCALLGLDALNFANEGKLVLVVAPESEQAVLNALRSHELGQDACSVGQVTTTKEVEIRGIYGITHILDLPKDEPLPRIC